MSVKESRKLFLPCNQENKIVYDCIDIPIVVHSFTLMVLCCSKFICFKLLRLKFTNPEPWWEGRPEGKRPLGRHRHMWEDNIMVDIREIGGGGMDWIDLAEDRDQWRALVNTVMNLRVP
jgi:hypothetical protein